MGSAPSELSIVSETSARPSGGRPEVPAKITSSILPPRRLLAPCSPITQLSASTTFDLPEPLGPTTQVMPGSRRSVVADAKDLNPRMVRVLRCTDLNSSPDLRKLNLLAREHSDAVDAVFPGQPFRISTVPHRRWGCGCSVPTASRRGALAQLTLAPRRV